MNRYGRYIPPTLLILRDFPRARIDRTPSLQRAFAVRLREQIAFIVDSLGRFGSAVDPVVPD